LLLLLLLVVVVVVVVVASSGAIAFAVSTGCKNSKPHVVLSHSVPLLKRREQSSVSLPVGAGVAVVGRIRVLAAVRR
jgi:flagellar basal body-associated protein FliL